MPVIGVIGANGQVGSEVCLYLSQMPGIKVVPICRTSFGSTFLRLSGLECRHGTLDNKTAKGLLEGCDLVADFSLPRGQLSFIRSAIKQTLSCAIGGADPGARFVYISSIVALGMSGRSERLGKHFLAHTSYGSSKRYGERLTFTLGRKHAREVYVLRLGQVHGELQSATRNIKRELRNEATYVPRGPSYTVFAYTIAEALARISEGREQPDVYTLVSVPAWSWKEIHEFYCQQKGVTPDIVEYENSQNPMGSLARKTLSLLKKRGVAFIEKHREIIISYFLFAFPNTEEKIAAIRSRRRAASEISSGLEEGKYKPYGALKGVAPGRRLQSLTDSRLTMGVLSNQVQNVLGNLTRRSDISVDTSSR